jgi:integrase
VGEVLARYAEDRGKVLAAPATLAYSISALAPFWGDLTCDAVKGSTCRLYERERAQPRAGRDGRERTAGSATIRRELGVLQAALNHAHGEGLLIHPIKVTLPKAGEPRERWLTRAEAAKLLRAAAPHVRRFILISLYTGRRASAVLDLTWTRVDLDAGVIRFRTEGAAETNKRRGRVRIRRLAAHLRRWRAGAGNETHVVAYRGERVDAIKTGIRRAAERAGFEDVTPHVLKHTAITWAVMNPRLSIEGAAEFFDTSPETIRKHYWHHSPHHQAEGLDSLERAR